MQKNKTNVETLNNCIYNEQHQHLKTHISWTLIKSPNTHTAVRRLYGALKDHGYEAQHRKRSYNNGEKRERISNSQQGA